MRNLYSSIIPAFTNKKKSLRLVAAALFLLLGIMPVRSWSQTTVTWAGTPSPGNGVVSPANANFTPTAVTPGANLGGTPAFTTNGYGTFGTSNSNKGWNESSLTNAVTNKAYIEYKLALNCNVAYAINSVSFTTITSAGSITAANSDVRYSTDPTFATFTSLGSFTASTSSLLKTYTPSISVQQN